jgi:uroporphyrinogen-III decarboxylase
MIEHFPRQHMTSRQRMLAAIYHEPVDRVPVAPWGLGRLDPHSPLAVELIARTDPWLEVGLGCDAIGGAVFPMEEKRQGNLLRRTIHAPGRDLHATWTTTAQTTACTEYPCRSLDDIEALLSVPYVRPHPDVAHFHARQEQIGDDALLVMGLGDGLCYPNDMLGTEYCSYLWAAEPEIIRRMVATAAERVYAVVEEACRGGVDAFRIVGGEYATQLMGPRAWDELVVPYDGPLIEMIHAHGGIAHYHNHGNMQRFLENIAALGIDSLDPVEQPPYGDIRMGDAAARIGDRVCLVGGLDDMEILETRPHAEVLRLGEAILQSVGQRGYMLGGTSSGIYGEAAARNFIALVDVAAKCA